MFKTMTSVFDTKKHPSDDEIQKISSYIFCRWLSGSPYTIAAANAINTYSQIPIENQYHLIKSAFCGKIKYIQYPKASGVEELQEIENISDYFKISLEKAKEYLGFISNVELKEINNIYSKSK